MTKDELRRLAQQADQRVIYSKPTPEFFWAAFSVDGGAPSCIVTPWLHHPRLRAHFAKADHDARYAFVGEVAKIPPGQKRKVMAYNDDGTAAFSVEVERLVTPRFDKEGVNQQYRAWRKVTSKLCASALEEVHKTVADFEAARAQYPKKPE